jgi:hypothetical protein
MVGTLLAGLAGVAAVALWQYGMPPPHITPARVLASRARPPAPPLHNPDAAARRDKPSRSLAGPAVRQGTSGADWVRKFRASDDYLQFVKGALPAALKGDGRASWYIAEALRACARVSRSYHGSADPEAQLQQELATRTAGPQWVRDLVTLRTRRCLGLAREDPFAAMPAREGGYTDSYWYDQALADGEPLAEEYEVAKAIAYAVTGGELSDAQKTEKLASAESNLRLVVESGDPDALYRAGEFLMTFGYLSDPLNGPALALAACDLGSDCSANNPESYLFYCRLSAACPADYGYADLLQQNLGAEEFGQIYARAQEIKQALEAGDSDAVMKFLTPASHP